jgi:hypothetical protein
MRVLIDVERGFSDVAVRIALASDSPWIRCAALERP